MFGDPLDHPPLSRGVAALHDDDHPLALLTDPLLHAHQLLLEPEQGLVVLVAVCHSLILPRGARGRDLGLARQSGSARNPRGPGERAPRDPGLLTIRPGRRTSPSLT